MEGEKWYEHNMGGNVRSGECWVDFYELPLISLILSLNIKGKPSRY